MAWSITAMNSLPRCDISSKERPVPLKSRQAREPASMAWRGRIEGPGLKLWIFGMKNSLLIGTSKVRKSEAEAGHRRRLDAAARVEDALHFHPFRRAGLHAIGQHAVHDMLMENPEIAIVEDVFLETLQ